MLQPPATWTWTGQREQAAALVADNTQSDEQIAAAVGITRMTLRRWRTHPAFEERVSALVDTFRTELKHRGIAERQNRVDALNDRWQKMQAVIEARAAGLDAEDYEGLVPKTFRDAARSAGFGTGLLAVEWKASAYSLKPVFKVDTGLLAEMRATEQQAAQELGQWDDGHSNETTVVIKQIIGIDRDAL